jgi:hypothetical protein
MADAFTKDEQQAWNRMAAAGAEKPVEEPEPQEAIDPLPPEEVAPELEPEPAEAQPEEGERQGWVPSRRLKEESDRRQELERENRRLAEERTRFDERLRVVMEMRQAEAQQRAEPPAPRPTAQTDPIGTIESLDDRLARLEYGGQQQNEYIRQQQDAANIYNAAMIDATQFRQQQPDYGNAYDYFRQTRAAELQTYGYTPQQIQKTIGDEEFAIAAGSFQRGVSPAQTLYRVAQARGYQPQSQPMPNGNANGSGGDAQVARINQGQRRSQTLSGTGGGAGPTEMTADRLIKMSNAEFDAWTTKNPAKAKRLLGG